MGTRRILPQVAWVETFLSGRGWTKLGEGPAGSLWGGPGADELAVPASIDNDHEVATSLISRISSATQLSFEDVFDGIVYSAADVIDMRVSGAGIGGGWIPWKSAEKIVGRGRDAFRAAGTTAMGMKPEIKGNYSRLADSIVDSAQLSHTNEGSFVFPIIVRLSSPMLEQGTGSGSEPIERRITRTFAESLKAVHNLIAANDAPTLHLRDTAEWVKAGVSRELCSALGEILQDQRISRVTTDFRWATAGPEPGSLPESLSFDSGQAISVLRAAELLRAERELYADHYSGRIVGLSGEADEFCVLILQTMRRGYAIRLEVRVAEQEFDLAAGWCARFQTIVVEGAVRQGPGRSWIMDKPLQLHPLALEAGLSRR
jgi:hypothetical protein